MPLADYEPNDSLEPVRGINPRTSCSIGVALMRCSSEDHATLLAWLADKPMRGSTAGHTAQAVATSINQASAAGVFPTVVATSNSVQRHRDGRCSCGTR